MPIDITANSDDQRPIVPCSEIPENSLFTLVNIPNSVYFKVGAENWVRLMAGEQRAVTTPYCCAVHDKSQMAECRVLPNGFTITLTNKI